jgi:dethiobiotin synthetase
VTVLVVTGTDTGVGKTVVTAALVVAARRHGSVVVVKPVQTGLADDDVEPADLDEVRRLAGDVDVVEPVRLPDPLAPDSAARRRGTAIPPVSEHATLVRELSTRYDTVLVEGAGGLLVRLDTSGGTLLDLAAELTTDLDVRVLVVVRAGLGTLNHTELTVAALRARGLDPAGLVIGSWPVEPGLAEECNRDDLPRVTGVPLVGMLPAGAGSLAAAQFRAARFLADVPMGSDVGTG